MNRFQINWYNSGNIFSEPVSKTIETDDSIVAVAVREGKNCFKDNVWIHCDKTLLESNGVVTAAVDVTNDAFGYRGFPLYENSSYRIVLEVVDLDKQALVKAKVAELNAKAEQEIDVPFDEMIDKAKDVYLSESKTEQAPVIDYHRPYALCFLILGTNSYLLSSIIRNSGIANNSFCNGMVFGGLILTATGLYHLIRYWINRNTEGK